jgi:hypothetical protein
MQASNAESIHTANLIFFDKVTIFFYFKKNFRPNVNAYFSKAPELPERVRPETRIRHLVTNCTTLFL